MQLSNAPSPVGQSPNASKRPMRSVPEPSPLCRWTIHIIDSETIDEPIQHSTNGEGSEDCLTTPFEQKLQKGLEDNCFSTVDATELPIHVSDIATAVRRSPEEIFKQSLGFAIMGRNILLVEQLLKRARNEKKEFADIYPFHLAATYLDGSKSCCQIFAVSYCAKAYQPSAQMVLDQQVIQCLTL